MTEPSDAQLSIPPGIECSPPIAILIESLSGGGAQQVVSRLLAHWDASGRETVLVTLRGPEVDVFPVPAGTRRVVIGGARASRNPIDALAGNLGRIGAVRRALRGCGAAVVVSFLTSMNVTAVLASRGLGLPLVVCERNDPRRQPIGPAWRALRRISYPLADCITANSEEAVRALRPLGRSVAYLPNPLRGPGGDEVAQSNGRLILAVGRLHRQKRFDLLIDAVAARRDELAGWGLRILGTGSELETLRRQAQALDLAVEFPGYVADPFPHYRAAELFVMPSDYEGSPNALWEAMSCGAACLVSSSIADADPAVVAGACTSFAAGDRVALADALVRLAGDTAQRAALAAAATTYVARFAPDAAFAAWDALIERVARGRSRAEAAG